MMQFMRDRVKMIYWVVILSFAVLLVTGLPQKWPTHALSVATVELLGGIFVTRWLHRAAGIAFALLVAVSAIAMTAILASLTVRHVPTGWGAITPPTGGSWDIWLTFVAGVLALTLGGRLPGLHSPTRLHNPAFLIDEQRGPICVFAYLRLDRPNMVQPGGGPATGSEIIVSESLDLSNWRQTGSVMAGRPPPTAKPSANSATRRRASRSSSSSNRTMPRYRPRGGSLPSCCANGRG